MAGADLNRGTYTGQAGGVYIEPRENARAYDREVFLVLKEFEPSWSRGGDMAMDMLAGVPLKALQQMGSAAGAERTGRKATAGVMKDVGQVHMDFGFKALFKYA
jgi:hypothetical protein